MICLYCKKEIIQEGNKPKKYCSDNCRLSYFRLLKKDETIESEPVETIGNETIEINKDETIEKEPIKTGIGTGVCHGCQRKFVDVKSQWVDGKANEENAKLLCICLECVGKGTTHEGLGLDIKKCEDYN